MARRLGSRAKLREHFLTNIGRVMDAEELRGIAGANEYGRRIRELRNEEGYQILTHNDRSTRKPGEYLLLSGKPQPAFARASQRNSVRWCLIATSLRARCAARLLDKLIPLI